MIVNREKVATTVDKVLALKKLTAMTGTRTTRGQGELLQVLNAEEMALAAQMLIQKEGQISKVGPIQTAKLGPDQISLPKAHVFVQGLPRIWNGRVGEAST
jgi:hypothetical protein